jgi:hypothetical protein
MKLKNRKDKRKLKNRKHKRKLKNRKYKRKLKTRKHKNVAHRTALPLLRLSFYENDSQFALPCEGSSTQRFKRSSVYWQFLAWNSLHFSEQE